MEDKNSKQKLDSTESKVALEQSAQDKANSRKNRLILIFFILGFFIVGTIGLVAILKINDSYKENQDSKFIITIDPSVVTAGGTTHLAGAQRFSFEDLEKDGGVNNTHIETQINYGQYFCYSYIFKNDSDKEVSVQLDLKIEQTNNASLTYAINGGEESNAIDRIFNVVIAPQNTERISVYVRVVGSHADAYVKGVLTLTLEEMGEE